MIYTFNIGISMGIHADGDTIMDYNVTEEELELINKCKEER